MHYLTYISVTIGLAIALACAWYCRRLATEKGRGVVRWTLLGFVLTVVAVPVLVLLPSVSGGSVEKLGAGHWLTEGRAAAPTGAAARPSSSSPRRAAPTRPAR